MVLSERCHRFFKFRGPANSSFPVPFIMIFWISKHFLLESNLKDNPLHNHTVLAPHSLINQPKKNCSYWLTEYSLETFSSSSTVFSLVRFPSQNQNIWNYIYIKPSPSLHPETDVSLDILQVFMRSRRNGLVYAESWLFKAVLVIVWCLFVSKSRKTSDHLATS